MRNAANRCSTNTTPMPRGAWRAAQKSEIPFEDFARDKFIIGDKVSVKEEIARYHELLGVNHFIMRCQWPGLPVERTSGVDPAVGRDFRLNAGVLNPPCPGAVPASDRAPNRQIAILANAFDFRRRAARTLARRTNHSRFFAHLSAFFLRYSFYFRNIP